MLKPAATGNTWGFSSIWSGGANGSNISTNLRETSRSRDHTLQVKTPQHEEIEGKTGSGSLVDSSVSEDFVDRGWATRIPASGRPMPTGRHTDNTLLQQRSASNAGLQTMPAAHTSLMSVGSRHQFSNSNQTATAQSRQRYNSTFEYKNDFAAQPSEQPPFKVYTKHDRPVDPAHGKPDSANGYSSTTPSPCEERRPPFSLHYGRTASMPTSQDGSLPPSRGAEEANTWTPIDYSSRSSQRVTPDTSRAPSVSAKGNGAYNPYFNVNVDAMSSNLRQLNINDNSRPSTSYKQSFGLQSYSGFQGASQPAMARPGQYREDDMDPLDRANMQYLELEVYARDLPTNNISSSSLAERCLNGGGMHEFRPGQPYVGSGMSCRSQDRTNGSRTPSEWQNFSGGAQLTNRRSPAVAEQPSYLDPRFQQFMAAQFHARHPYGMYSPYALQQLGQQYVQLMPLATTTFDMPATPRDSPITDCVQSALMYEFKSNTKTKRYELRDIYEHIAEFSGDQHGSRFIQTKLETANSDEKEHVFREIEPNAIPLMTDVFGNYVIQKFFEHGDQTHKKILANKMRGQVLALSLQTYGCRVVQKALDHVLVDQQRELITELENHVLKCVKDQNGNHVIQKVIERCQATTIGFIVTALQGQVQQLSIHPYGCRVIQRCLEKSDLPSKSMIMAELMQGIPSMIADHFGNYVVQHVVEHDGGGEGRQQVLNIVASGLEGYSKHKYASNVVEACLVHADDLWRQRVMYQLLEANARRTEGEGVLVGMIRDQYGNYVIRKCSGSCVLLRITYSIADTFTEKFLDTLVPNDFNRFLGPLHPAMAQAKRGCPVKHIISIEKKMHRFDPHRTSSINHGHGLPFHGRNGLDFPLPMQVPMQMPMAMQPFGTNYHSTATTPPPLTSDTQSLQSSCLPSVNGDAVEGAASSRKGSDPSSLYSIDDVQRR